MSATSYAWVVLAFPLAGMLVCAFGYRRLPGHSAGWIASLSILGSFVASILMLLQLQDLPAEERALVDSAFTYFKTAGMTVDLSILVDPLSVFMCLVVSGISFFIHVYSIGYMDGDEGFVRYFAYLNYFVFSMLLLVLAANFVILIVGWAFVGAASYLLISFWYRRTTATRAGIKAFVINVIGDVGLVIGTFLLFNATGALDYEGVFSAADNVFTTNDGQLVAACLMLLVGAFAKSGQLPLHTWLPDAMEGPTPVSSLIHAATMVTAGVYLIARMYPLFELAPLAADISAVIGTATLLFAATVAVAVTDLKRVIAYSTISQIGYMILGVSSAAYGAGLFHLMTHAFFKALLFMGAGSVIGAMAGNQSLDRMGGFRKAMPFTFVTFTIGALALSGFPLMSGFFSKDEILSYTLNRGGGFVVMGVVGYLAAAITGFYAFRMVFRVFFRSPVPEARELEQGHPHHGEPHNPATGEPEDKHVGFDGTEHHNAESTWTMKFAMAPLALGAVIAGYVAVPGVTDTLEKFLEPTFADSRYIDDVPTDASEYADLGVGSIMAFLGIGLAFVIYMRRRELRLVIRERFDGVHTFLVNKWYFDEIYDAAIVRPIAAFGRFGRTVIETRFVQGAIVGGAVGLVRAGSSAARTVQSGYLRGYAALVVIGVTALGVYFLITAAG